jgi:hypothetical protein
MATTSFETAIISKPSLEATVTLAPLSTTNMPNQSFKREIQPTPASASKKKAKVSKETAVTAPGIVRRINVLFPDSDVASLVSALETHLMSLRLKKEFSLCANRSIAYQKISSLACRLDCLPALLL